MSKRKLLLADDSITIQKVVNLTFADEGIEVISVGDGDSAMQKFDEFLPDLVMADVNMPGLNGYEICQIIKQNDDTRRIPVILLVGSFEPFDEAEASRVGADDFLTKPFQSIRQLVNKVNELLDRNSRVAEEMPLGEAEHAPAADTFAETIEIETNFENNREAAPPEFGDAGMDDEMIETSPANAFTAGQEFETPAETTVDYAKTQPLSADDLKGFSIVPVAAGFEPDASLPETAAEPEAVEENFADAETTSETAKEETAVEEEETIAEEPELDYYAPIDGETRETAPSESETAEPETSEQTTIEPETAESETADFSGAAATEDLSETATAADEEPAGAVADEAEMSVSAEPATQDWEETQTSAADQTAAEKAPEESAADFAETEANEAAETVSSVNFDDGDLLELPPLVEETGIRPQTDFQQFAPEPETEPIAEPIAEPETEPTADAERAETPDEAAASLQSFPPELIEAIAQKVAEKISDKAIRDIARKVVPQITELIIKKMAEQDLKSKK